MSRISDLILSAQEAKEAEEALDALHAYERNRNVALEQINGEKNEQRINDCNWRDSRGA